MRLAANLSERCIDTARMYPPGYAIYIALDLGALMNRLLAVAAFLAAFTAVVHIFAGGEDIAAPLLASTLAGEPKLTLYAVWHMASVALAMSAVALFVGSLPHHAHPARYLVLFVSALWCAFGVVFLAVVAIQPESGWLFKLPQWVLLLPVGLLGLWAAGPNTALQGTLRGKAAQRP